jgi:hypothetical protein
MLTRPKAKTLLRNRTASLMAPNESARGTHPNPTRQSPFGGSPRGGIIGARPAKSPAQKEKTAQTIQRIDCRTPTRYNNPFKTVCVSSAKAHRVPSPAVVLAGLL